MPPRFYGPPIPGATGYPPGDDNGGTDFIGPPEQAPPPMPRNDGKPGDPWFDPGQVQVGGGTDFIGPPVVAPPPGMRPPAVPPQFDPELMERHPWSSGINPPSPGIQPPPQLIGPPAVAPPPWMRQPPHVNPPPPNPHPPPHMMSMFGAPASLDPMQARHAALLSVLGSRIRGR